MIYFFGKFLLSIWAGGQAQLYQDKYIKNTLFIWFIYMVFPERLSVFPSLATPAPLTGLWR